jgi:hypothetical protein
LFLKQTIFGDKPSLKPTIFETNDLQNKRSLTTGLATVLSVKNGGVTASTEMLAAKRHTGAHSPVSGAKTIIANSNQFAYAA